MAFISDAEKERAQEFIRRYSIPITLDEMLAYVSSVYAEGRADERKECLKCVNEIQLNALKAQRMEVGKSQSGIDFQSGRRKGAEDAIALIAARSALQIKQDSLPASYPEADEAAAAEPVAEAEVEPAPVEVVNFDIEPDDDEDEIIQEMQIDVTDEADEVYDPDDDDDIEMEDDEDEVHEELPEPEPEPEVVQKRPIKKRVAAKKTAAKKTKPKRR